MLIHLVEQHIVDAAFLWRRRDVAVVAPHVRLADLLRIDERVEAHLDGLRVADGVGFVLCRGAAARGAPGEVFTTAVLALERGELDAFGALVDLAAKEQAAARALVSALGWIGPERGVGVARDLLDPACDPPFRFLGLAAHAVWRRDPERALEYAMTDPVLEIRARALRAVGELGRSDLLDIVLADLDHEEPEIRFWAAWTAARFGLAAAGPVLFRLAEEGTRAEAAASAAIVVTPVDEARARLLALGAMRGRERAFLRGIEALGCPAMIDDAIRLSERPELARRAGAAVAGILGVDLAKLGLAERPGAGLPDVDDPLPKPAVAHLRAYWSEASPAFAAGTRYLLGRPRDAAGLARALLHGGQTSRALAAFELARLGPGSLFDVRAPASRQRAALASER